ncbi:methyl-accepting chemotaxis protein [Bacillus canaveralius]|uniref:Methyl-accepting chemotaxis protein n=1 Tax=Bacillus canaveralius TaxID=1403243 RepID=A0A2N5GS61_9BACI|nr:methyl-accepting chemotaxis protein [Bacillus canaveralius]PLR86382.1 methyl-accepting chemotaxis protein [Bacillus canaveralius]PLR98615.1 methyl-accepting chemotaxis protein [Bacillus canaveralius]RSK53947.1 methyl-accepting chemotaxis protein [Bacillus canaveralius]
MSIRKKLFMLLGVLIVSLLLLGTYSIIQLKSTHEKNTELTNAFVIENHLKHIQYRLAGLSNDERAFLIQGDAKFPEQMEEKAQDVLKSIETVKGMVNGSEEHARITDVEKGFNEYWAVSQRVVDQYKTNTDEALDLHFGEERTIRKEILDPKIDEYLEDLTAEIDGDNKKLEADINRFMLILIILTIAVSALGIIFGLVVIASILRPLHRLNTQMKEIATGEADLTKQILVKNRDELGELSSSFNDFIQTIRQIIVSIKTSSEQVAASSEQFSASAEQSKVTSEQVSHSMQEIAASTVMQSTMTEESTISLRESLQGLTNITTYSTDVAGTTNTVKEKAENGASAVNQIVEQMQSIQSSVENTVYGITSLADSASKISDFTALINDIAAQTNLLALNAAIEAARAGEHGKGFAVVAEEVRKLAEQSGESANQIKEIVVSIQRETEESVNSIQNVKEDVSSGMMITKETATQFNEILNSIESVSSQIQEIAATSQQLNSGFELVTNSVEDMSALTKETTERTELVAASTEEQLASSEEILNAANSLTSLAEDLQGMIKRFQI